MARPDRTYDWHQLDARKTGEETIDSRVRIGWLWIGFGCLAALVFTTLLTLEWRDGPLYRSLASQPLEWRHRVPGLRGRILARDGTVLAEDQRTVALALHYRYLQREPLAAWLRRQARQRLAVNERRNPQSVAEMEASIRAERIDLHARLAELCDLSTDEWQMRIESVERRVAAIAERVNQRQAERFAAVQNNRAVRSLKRDLAATWWQRTWGMLDELFADDVARRPPEPITVAEELDYHVLVENLSLEVVSEIEAHAARYPGVRLVEHPRRHYPAGELAAHVVGHMGPEVNALPDVDGNAGEQVGRMGIERQYELLLRGRLGEVVERTDRSGHLLSTERTEEPTRGRDVVLTLDRRLQSTAETLLDQALSRRFPSELVSPHEQAGGAVVVLDVRQGDLLAVASAPRFDPNWFAMEGNSSRLADLLTDRDDPLYDRATRMTIPPGSVFKIVSALALLEAGGLDPEAAFDCQGYWRQPDRLRCALFARQGLGHGEMTLPRALAESCNVYFFHHAAELGPAALVDWSLRLGFGRATGVDLPDESSGVVPTPGNIRELEDRTWRTSDTQALAIGQGSLTVTPLQVARLMATVANGGYLVTPRIVSHLGLPLTDAAGGDEASDELLPSNPPRRIDCLNDAALRAVRQGLERAVVDPDGTAHAGIYLAELSVAAKTGTAESGGGRSDHAWLAGYAPADNPRVAFVVVLQHGGDGGTAAAPVARRMVQRLDELGYLERRRSSITP